MAVVYNRREINYLAERGGFEPPVQVLTPYNRLANDFVEPGRDILKPGLHVFPLLPGLFGVSILLCRVHPVS